MRQIHEPAIRAFNIQKKIPSINNLQQPRLQQEIRRRRRRRRSLLRPKRSTSDIGIIRNVMGIIDSFINDIFERWAHEDSRLARYKKNPIINSPEIQTAMTLVLSSEIFQHAVSKRTRAVTLSFHRNRVRALILQLKIYGLQRWTAYYVAPIRMMDFHLP